MATYDLKNNSADSELFYSTLGTFSVEVFEYIDKEAGPLLHEYALFLEQKLQKSPRSDGEYAIEFLTLGMVLNRYLGASKKSSVLLIHLMRFLFLLRRKNLHLKRVADLLRGYISGLFFVPHIGAKAVSDKVTMKSFARLIHWLEATGEFKDEVKRFVLWKQFLKTKSEEECNECFSKAVAVFDWFRKRADKELAVYTSGVGVFLQKRYSSYRFREDEIFCGKEEVEYHINMVGSEIMNWGFREEFLVTGKKAVLLPGCMRAQSETNCAAMRRGLDIICTGCTEQCKVNRISLLGKQHDFEVYIIPHSSGFSRWLKRWENTKEYGVVAVACLLNIVVGGYEMRELHIPSQCVLLDYCGCKKHWHPEGLVTDLNERRLLKVLKEGA